MNDAAPCDHLVEALERHDEKRRQGRAERIRWSSLYNVHAVGLFAGETEMLNLLREAWECFVDGHFIATLTLATALVEHVITEELERAGRLKDKMRFEDAIATAREASLFPFDLLDQANSLRELRNGFAHRRQTQDKRIKDSLGSRYRVQRKHPTDILEEDARTAIVAMFGHFRHTLRRG